ncbi:hypothetical protein NEOLEDRAFT_1052883 [Neolentinus lepideus HHB14362 ss-1]|uniref:F-box domain-containing protein n=1 Tax=Neolentinus lepideus HHB14362 ss-1 TaxID=1314782 RepID=A0A165WBP9_9AGAM|nr:hypothetical protein NEOLEDRAFT_1052883 [Neolentinus lepideus HHB14362 ss-1]
MSGSLQFLPPELYYAILSHVSPDDLQMSILHLSIALPRSPIPVDLIYHSIRLKFTDQVVRLTRRLRNSPEHALLVKEFSLETWTVDADVLINLVRSLPNLISLRLFIGPNYAPEHMEDLFCKPWARLSFIGLRFRPYVQKATYYQFMKGAYFDSMLDALSTWPSSSLPTLSIIQDPLDPNIPKLQHFAQPLVFFRLDPFTGLVRAPFLRALTHFRLRIPARQVAQYIYAKPGALESVEVVDLSTCNVGERDVDLILGRFGRLKHLLLDNCSILRGEFNEVAWRELGKECALAGVRRAREREKKLKAWLEMNYVPPQGGDDADAPAPGLGTRIPGFGHSRAPKRGRKGLATATISLREREEPVAGPSTGTIRIASTDTKAKIPKIRVLPRAPTLLSLSTTVRHDDKHAVIRAEFERGWSEGIAQLSATAARLRASYVNNVVRVVKFTEDADGVMLEEGMEGLGDAGLEDFDFDVSGAEKRYPVLCLAGPGRGEGHVEGCGHQVGWDVWRDEL